MEPRRTVLAPGLELWASEEGGPEERSAIVRIGSGTDAHRAADVLEHHGATIESAGAGSITCRFTRSVLQRVASEPWVLAVQEPRQMFFREGFPSS